MSTRTVADHLVGRLYDAGIDTVFGVHGANIEDVFDAVARHPDCTPVIAKHEFGAGAMADGLARVRDGYAAVLTTSGAGALNVIPALAESYDSRVPVLAVIGSAPRAAIGAGGFQDMLSPPDTIDIAAVLGGVVGSCVVIRSVAQVAAAVDQALATLDRGFPAALVIPKDVQSAAMSDCASTPSDTRLSRDPRALADVAATLAEVVAAGGSVCVWAGAETSRHRLREPLSALVDALGATMVVSPEARDVAIDECAGVTGVMGHPSAHRALADADMVLAIGTRMSSTERAGLDEILGTRTVLHIGGHPPRAPGLAKHLCVPDIGWAVAELTDQVRSLGQRTRVRQTRQMEYLPTPPTVGLGMRTSIEIVGAALPDHAVMFADAGNTGAAAIHHLPWSPARFVVALGMGGMGYAIAAGIGTAIGTPAPEITRVVIVCGDGSFFMHGMELHTAVEYGAPVTLIVLNNDAHGMCVTRERQYFPETPALNRFRHTDIAGGIAAMFGGLTVRHAPDAATLRGACAEFMTASGPNCIVVDVDPDEIPPFAPFVPEGAHDH
ncbi:thiamine pyrophosphate-binding protein [Gordonia sp. CPCC 205515]|uniref:thiamine pyrophosphate-binding protein n=1 Tax=Gordonia sp. CPCC 205515 TaxID=3140791 RepID=UPI003AF34200